MKDGKFKTLFGSEFISAFALTQLICWFFVVVYFLNKAFDLNWSVSGKDAFAAFIISVTGILVYLFTEILSRFIKK